MHGRCNKARWVPQNKTVRSDPLPPYKGRETRGLVKPSSSSPHPPNSPSEGHLPPARQGAGENPDQLITFSVLKWISTGSLSWQTSGYREVKLQRQKQSQGLNPDLFQINPKVMARLQESCIHIPQELLECGLRSVICSQDVTLSLLLSLRPTLIALPGDLSNKVSPLSTPLGTIM